MPSTGLPHPFGSLPGHSVVLSSRVSPSPLSSLRFQPPLVELHPGPIPPGPPGGCRCMLILQLLRGVIAFPLPRPSTPCLRRCAAPSLWSRVWQSAHQFLLLPWDSPAFSTAIHSANWDCWSPYLAASDKVRATPGREDTCGENSCVIYFSFGIWCLRRFMAGSGLMLRAQKFQGHLGRPDIPRPSPRCACSMYRGRRFSQQGLCHWHDRPALAERSTVFGVQPP
ncbi:uncharacterized protein LOC115833370 [Nomascus leucogenys]|uniref:uncharacterized protein LOC115833370 n=1 Tax=Nomascus leucogenys TaxID=61853 RepID=UPI00122D713B|nr:uncharacterized protein LOC115833370 [Nomascus leucogenys]